MELKLHEEVMHEEKIAKQVSDGEEIHVSKMFAQEIWKQDYPKMPESFHLALKEVVEKNCHEIPPVIPKKINWKKFFILGIAATLTMGIAVAGVAATQVFKKKEETFHFEEYLGYENREGIEDLFQTEIEVQIAEEAGVPLMVYEWEDEKAREQYIYNWKLDQKERENNEPLLEIREVMFDGLILAIHAVATEEGEKYSLGCDTINIGDKCILLEEGGKVGKGKDYIFMTHIRDLERTNPLEVIIPLQVYRNGQRYENQDIILEVPLEAEMICVPDQEIVLERCTVKASEIVKSHTAVMMKLEVLMTEKQREAYDNENRQILELSVLKSEDGTIWRESGNIENGAYNIVVDPDRQVWYVYAKMPEPNMEKVFFDLISYEKSTQEGEKIDIEAPENIWEKEIEISLEEK